MHAGDLSAYVRFDQDAGTDDQATGARSQSTTTLCTRPVRFVSGIHGVEFADLRERFPGATAVAICRRDSQTALISSNHRATWIAENRVFQVLGALEPDGTRRERHIALKEKYPTNPRGS